MAKQGSIADLSDDTSDGDVSERIRRAEAAIASLRSNFVAWVGDDLDAIRGHLAKARITSSIDERLAAIEDIRRIAHNIKGQAGTFGFDALTVRAAALDAAIKTSGASVDLTAIAELCALLHGAFAQACA